MRNRYNNLAVEIGGRRGIRSSRNGFTMIELLIVVTLTLTMLALLFGPLISGFQTTARAQLEAQAHDSGRQLMNELTRELSSAVAIRDTGGGMMYGYVMAKVNANDSTGKEVMAHMPGAYTDIVPPQHMFQSFAATPPSVPTVTDPTTGRNLVLEQKTFSTAVGSVGSTTIPVEPDLVTPTAPDNAIIRYFIGLKYPSNLAYSAQAGQVAVPQPYTNIYDRENVSSTDATWGTTDVAKGSLNNTYIMYRAFVRPYTTTGATPAVDQTLFDTTTDSQGNTVPVLDDPDFFRIVTDNDPLPVSSPHYDTNPANSANNTYGIGGKSGASLTAAHNVRVYTWIKASHPLINVANMDSLAYLRPGNQLAFVAPISSGLIMPATQLNPATQAGSVTFDTDGVTPLVPPTMTITSGGALQEAATAQLTSNVSEGAGAAGYIPTVYRTSQGQIQGYPTITLTSSGVVYTTSRALAADVGVTTLVNGATIASTDLVEYGPSSSTTAAYDITQGSAVTSKTAFIALAYDPSTGSLNFAVPSIPPISSSATADSTNPRNPYWAGVPTPQNSSIPSSNLVLNLADTSAFPGNPIGAGISPAGQIVVNSEQVRGPDKTPGPNALQPVVGGGVPPAQYSLVPYTRVSDPGQVGINQYAINYSTGQMVLAPWSAWGSDLTSSDPQKKTVLVSYKYQNNTSTAGPAGVTVSYTSSNLVSIGLGIRVYDTSTKIAAFFSQTNTVAIGNGSQ